MIVVNKKNETALKVTAEPSILQELSDHFSFDVPGAKFHPLFRSKMWDGKVRLFSMFTGELPVGLLEYLLKFAEAQDYAIEVKYTKIADKCTVEQATEFCQSLQITARNAPIEIRDYQVDAIHQGIVDARRLLLSPTGSGKSLIIYGLIRWHQQFDRKQLIIVPTTALVSQMYSDFADYSTANGWDAAANCYKITGGIEKRNDSPITISTWQSVFKQPKEWFAQFDVVFVDEVHLAAAKSITSIMNKCTQTPYRIGTTGTLEGSKTHKLACEGLFGPVYKVTSTAALIEKQQLANLKIHCLVLDYPADDKKTVKGMPYQEEIDWIVTNEKRNRFIRNLALAQKGNTLVLFQFVEKHGAVLFDLIQSKAIEGRRIFFVHGGIDADDREEIRHITETQDDAIIVASSGTFSTGVNIRNLHNIIFASPTKSRIRNLQSIGRGLRLHDTKVKCQLFDIGDDLSWKSKKNYTLTHLVERVKIYNEERFDYKLIKVDM